MPATRQPEHAEEEFALPSSTTARAVQRHTMIVLVITQVIGTVGVGVAPSIGVLLAGEVTANPAWAGLARTASTLGAALFGLPLGTLAGRLGRRSALSAGWWTAAAGSALLIAAAQWEQVVCLFVGLLLIGAGSAVSLQARFAASDLAEPHHRARALALVVWVGTLGNVLGPNLGVPAQAMTSLTGLTVYAGAFLIAAVCLAVAGTCVFIWLRPDPLLILATRAPGSGPSTAPRRAGGVRRMLSEIRADPRARLAVAAIVTAQIVMVAIMTMAPVHVADHGGSITVVGITISLHIAGMYGLSPVVGTLADRIGHRATMGIGVLVLLAALTIGIIQPDQTAWIAASLILLGIGWSFVNVAGSALFSAVVSPGARAASQGGVDALSNLCGAIAAFLAGPLLAVTSFGALSAVAIAVLLPLVMLLAVQRRTTVGR